MNLFLMQEKCTWYTSGTWWSSCIWEITPYRIGTVFIWTTNTRKEYPRSWWKSKVSDLINFLLKSKGTCNTFTLQIKESTGIHKPCIPILLHIWVYTSVHDQRVQRKDFLGVHLDVAWENPSFELFDLPFDR